MPIMPKVAGSVIYLDKKLIKSAKAENIITPSELTWLTQEFRIKGSNITRRVLLDLYLREHFCSNIYQKEVDHMNNYIQAKRTQIRKFRKKISNLKK